MIIQNYWKLWRAILLLGSCAVLLTGCYNFGGTGGNNDLISMINRLQTQLPGVTRLVSAFAYVSGLMFTMKGIYALKVYGQMMTAMSPQHSIKVPLTYLLAGTILVFSPQIVNIAMMTVFSTSNPLQYPSNDNFSSNVYSGVLYLVQVVGFISFIRGWFILAHPQQQGGQSQFGKAMTHIIGGLCAINIGGAINILENSFIGSS